MKYLVLEADLKKNRADILALWARNLLPLEDSHRSDEDRFKWYYENNPYGSGTCWLLREEVNGRFVGTAGLGLRRFKVSNEVVSAGLLADFAVDKGHRNFFPALSLQKRVREALDSGVDFLYSTPVVASANVQLSLGHVKLGVMERYAVVLDTRPYLQRMMGGAGSRSLAPFLNSILRVFSRTTWQGVDKQFVVKQIEDFDSRFDALWERSTARFTVAGERTSRFLRWRYALFPGRRYFTIGLLTRDEEKLLAYVVYHVAGNAIVISDLYFEDADQSLTSLVRGFLLLVRQMGAASVTFRFLGPREIGTQLERFGFYARGDKHDVLVNVKADSRLLPVLHDASNWYFVPGDQDYL